jgi:hypothetical protein
MCSAPVWLAFRAGASINTGGGPPALTRDRLETQQVVVPCANPVLGDGPGYVGTHRQNHDMVPILKTRARSESQQRHAM